MRAREPDRAGFAVRSGVRLYYEVHGDGPTTVLLLPPWSIVHSRIWKLQVPYLARHAQVVVYDPSRQRTLGPAGRRRRRTTTPSWSPTRVAVLDAVGVQAAVVVGLSHRSRGCCWRWPPTTRTGCAVRSSSAPTSCSRTGRTRSRHAFEREREQLRRLGRGTRTTGARDQAGFAEFFFGEVFPEPHSTRQVEDAVAWALETDAETLVATQSPGAGSSAPPRRWPRPRRCAARRS